jgi:hypothetical protein
MSICINFLDLLSASDMEMSAEKWVPRAMRQVTGLWLVHITTDDRSFLVEQDISTLKSFFFLFKKVPKKYYSDACQCVME